MFRRIALSLLVLAIAAPAFSANAKAPKTLRIYFVGKELHRLRVAQESRASSLRLRPLAQARNEDFDTVWLKKYTGGWDNTNETKDYFEKLTLELRKAYPKLKINMVPVGHVMYGLNQWMKAGKVPGYTDIKQLFADGIHLNNVGSYVVGCTYLATLYKQSPKGLLSTPYKVEDANWPRNSGCRLESRQHARIGRGQSQIARLLSHLRNNVLTGQKAGFFPRSGWRVPVWLGIIRKGTRHGHWIAGHQLGNPGQRGPEEPD